MNSFATTRMSSKGQVVIPEEVRKKLSLEPGARFVVVGQGDVVILKAIQAPSMEQFDGLIRDARKQARSSGMKRSDISKATAEARRRK